MSYTALYRKFRPDTFEDVKGQDHIVKTLKNQIMADRIGHAYLFCGTRGTGKTSIAKILARAVNCEHPVNGSPCNECASCRAIASGASMNVIEIDAASNNGVDNIREIREEVAYPPTEGRYKVYIIDEVHMLSIGAFNALLKTLEEPPAYVIFILATTEAHKIPVTILSRCQRYDFRRISQETILKRLEDLMEQEHIEAEEKALRYVAKKGDGSMRDSLSLLDQCIAFYLGEKLTYDKVLEVLGAVDTEVFSQLLRRILKEDITGAIAMLDRLILDGRDLTQFVNDFTWYLRNLMLIKAADDMEDILDVSTENLVQLREEAAMLRNDTLMRFIRIFSELANSIRYSVNKRVMLEMALIKLCKPEAEKDELSYVERIRKLERQMEKVGALMQSMRGAGGYPGGAGSGTDGASDGAWEDGRWDPSMYGMMDGMPDSDMDPYSLEMSGSYAGAQGAGGGARGSYMGAQGAGGGARGSYMGAQGAGGGTRGNYMGAQGAGNGTPGSYAGAQGAGGGFAGAPGMAAPQPAYVKAAPEDLKKVRAMWKNIVVETPNPFRIALASAEVKYNAQDAEDNRLFVVFSDYLAERYINSTYHRTELERIIADRTGKQVEVKFTLAADEGIQCGKLSTVDLDERIREFIHTDIEIDDES